tara:strand:+ start:334 stop:828 length:495 start_codon:yes stop_codon:yes gene_type:complete
MYAIWLTFSKNDRKYLKNIINNIAKKYNAPKFEPHITVYGLIDLEINVIKKIINKISDNHNVFVTKKIKIQQSNDLWKTIYIELEYGKELKLIYKNLKESFKDPIKYQFNPHLSLIYKILPTKEKIKIINQLDIKNKFKIEEMAILKFFPEIEKWKIIKKYDLK